MVIILWKLYNNIIYNMKIHEINSNMHTDVGRNEPISINHYLKFVCTKSDIFNVNRILLEE